MNVEFRFWGNSAYRIYGITSFVFYNICAQCVETPGGSIHIPVSFRAFQNGWRIRKGSADEQPVRLRLGGNNRDISS